MAASLSYDPSRVGAGLSSRPAREGVGGRLPTSSLPAPADVEQRPGAPVFGNVPRLLLSQPVRVSLVERVPDVGLMAAPSLEFGDEGISGLRTVRCPRPVITVGGVTLAT
jgi:hypothetical protein